MRTHRIAVIPGDGTGPEVTAEATKVIDQAAAAFGFEVEYQRHDIGGVRYLQTKETLTGSDLELLRGTDAILFGAIGHPDIVPGILEQEILLRLRREFDQYVNVRPVRLLPGVRGPLAGVGPESLDFVVVRENSEAATSSTDLLVIR